jgi:hypothetical protein
MSPDNNIDINTAEIKELKRRVEMSVNREMMTPKDFIFLADYLFEQINESISESTLKRIWGYNSGYKIVRRHTLDVLSRLIGHNGWNAFVKDLKKSKGYDYRIASEKTICTSELKINDVVKLKWNKNSQCSLKYKGKDLFEITETVNSKLRQGETIKSSIFILGEPAFMEMKKKEGEEKQVIVLEEINQINKSK